MSNFCWERVNETCKRRTGSAVVVYLQLTTKSRGDKFSRDAGMPVMTLLPPSVPSLATSPTTMPRASAFWRSACLQWQTSSKKGLTCQGWCWCDHYLSKTSRLWSRRWRSRETTSGRWTRFLPKMTWTRCWSTTTSAWGATCAPWAGYWKTSPEQVRKVRMRSSSRLSSGTRRGWNQLKRNWYDQEVKDYLLKVAEAGPMGYLPNSKQTTQMKLKLLREEPADCVLRRTTNLSVALKHWHFVAKLFQEDEQKLRDAGYMWASPVKKTDAWDVLWVSHPRVIFTYCMHNRRYPTLVSMIPRYQYPSINDTQNRVSMIPQTKYQWYPDTSIQVSMIPRTEHQRCPEPSINDTLIAVSKYQRYPEPSINDTVIPVSKYQRYPEPSINHSPNKQQQTNRFTLNFWQKHETRTNRFTLNFYS